MPKYNYTGTSGSGKKVKGTVEADSEPKALANLKIQGIAVKSIKEVANSGMNMEIKIPGMEKKVKLGDLAVFARQFAVLIKAGMPLVKSLQTVTQQTESKPLREALVSVLEDVERGMSLSAAMKKREKVFPKLMTSLITVGEAGGFLDRSMESVAKTFKSELELKSRVKSAMTYPVIVGIVAVVAVIGMLIFVVPTFEKMFASLGADMPFLTQVLIDISHNMSWILPLLIVVVGVPLFWYRRNKTKDFVRAKMDPFRLKIPVFGKLNAKVAITRFSRNLGMMLSAGVPLMSALELVGASANNYVIEQAVNEIREGMATGKTFSSLIQGYPIFPPIVSQMIMVGEESGALPQMLDSIADFYDDEVKQATESLASAIEPIMIVGLGGLIGGMIVALYMPMFSLTSAMSQ